MKIQSDLPEVISLTGYQIQENEDGAIVGAFSLMFPHVESAHNHIVLSGDDANVFEVVNNTLKLKSGQRAN